MGRNKHYPLICTYCGKEYLCRSDRLYRQKYCSYKCMGFCRRGTMPLQNGMENPNWKGGQTEHTKGYVMIKSLDHPRAIANSGYVFEHILVMEKHLGRELVWKGDGHPESEIVHHKDGNKKNNTIENLVLTTYQEHMQYHPRIKK